MGAVVDEGRQAQYYVGVVKRRALLVLPVLLIVTGAAYLFSKHQVAQFRACADSVISTPSVLLGGSGATSKQDAARDLATKAALADSTAVAKAALVAARAPGRTPEGLLNNSTVAADQTANLLTFCVTDRSRQMSVNLANAYATAFATFSRQQTATQITTVLASTSRQIDQVRGEIRAEQAAGTVDQGLLRNLGVLLARSQQLQSALAAPDGNSTVTRPASNAVQVAPNTTRNTIAGVLLGLVLGLGVAFLREAMDTRLRSSDEVAYELRLPLLARIPGPPRALRKRDRLALMEDGHGVHGEAYRKLRVGLDFANLDTKAKLVMVTSAVEQEGKSTTAANLAVALAQVGRRVILVDLDLRRPYLHRFFDLEAGPGVTDVALCHATLDQALATVAISSGGRTSRSNGNGNGNGNGTAAPVQGLLSVLPAGELPHDPAGFLESAALSAVLDDLRSRADLVLIDSPPVLPVSDAMAISSKVDGMIVVSRLEVVHRGMLRELRRELDSTQVARLGLVLTGAGSDSAYGYGSYSYGGSSGQTDPKVAAASPRA